MCVIAIIGTYDWRSLGRLHPATLLGGGLIVGLFLVMQASRIGPAIVDGKLSTLG